MKINKPWVSLGAVGMVIGIWIMRGLALIPRALKLLLIGIAAIVLAIIIGKLYFIIAIIILMGMYFIPKVMRLGEEITSKVKALVAFRSH